MPEGEKALSGADQTVRKQNASRQFHDTVVRLGKSGAVR